MSEQFSQILEMLIVIQKQQDIQNRKFTTFAQQAGYEFDDMGNATRVGGAIKHKSARFSFKQALIDAGACPDESQLFMDSRAKKKAVNSEQAYKMFLSGLGNYSVAQAVKICAGEQWKGFKVSWAENLLPEQKKKYSFFELAQGKHVENVAANNPNLAIQKPGYMADFAALELANKSQS